MNIQPYLGVWKSAHSVNFINYMKYIGYSPVICQIAKITPITLELSMVSDNIFQQKVSASYYKHTEMFKIDNQFYTYKNYKKQFYIENNNICCHVISTKNNAVWDEYYSLGADGQLRIQFIWNNLNKTYCAIQFYSKQETHSNYGN